MKTGTKTRSRNIILSSLMTLTVICLVLTGLFMLAPIEAHAAICNERNCRGNYSTHGVCDENPTHYQAAMLNKGVYEISNYGQFLWFAEQVNSGVGVSYNAKLTNDIAFSYTETLQLNGRLQRITVYRDFIRVGTSLSTSYRGTFDGNGFALTGVKIDDATLSNVGVFGYLNGGTVKNLKVTGLSLNGDQYVGGIAGYAMNATIENVMVGSATSSSGGGTVKGTDAVGGIVGYADSTTITGSWSNATLTATTNKGGIAGQVFSNTSNIENCYYLSTKADVGFNGDAANGEAVGMSAAQFASGEVAYRLGAPWGQNIDNGVAAQAIPQLNREALVYKALSCEGDGTAIFTNNSSVNEQMQAHVWGTDGFCKTNGNHYQPATLTTDRYDLDGDGNNDSVYEISNAGQLYWFANQVNSVNNGSNAILTNDITLNTGTFNPDGTYTASTVREWVPIGKSNAVPFRGIFDGNGKTISKLYYNDTSTDFAGLFGYVQGIIKNLGVVDSYIGGNYVGAIVGQIRSGTIENCYNRNSYVNSTWYDGAGGIVCELMENATVKNCWSNGTVTNNEVLTEGGIVTHGHGATVNCYYLDTAALRGVYDGGDAEAEAKTAAQFANGEVAYLLGSAWGQNIDVGTAQSYPVLGGRAVYQNNEANAYCDAYVYSNTDTDIFPTLHYYDTSTGICKHCSHQGEAKIGEIVYNTLRDAVNAVTDQTGTTITVLTDIDLGNVPIDIENKYLTITGDKSITGSYVVIRVNSQSNVTLRGVTIVTTGAANAVSVTNSVVFIEATIDASGSANASGVSMNYNSRLYVEPEAVIKGKVYGIKVNTLSVLGNNSISINLNGGEITSNGDYSIYTDWSVSTYDDVKIDIYIYDETKLNKPIYISENTIIFVATDIPEESYDVVLANNRTSNVFAYTDSYSYDENLNRKSFVSAMDGQYVQVNAEGALYIGECVHSELSYVETGTHKVTETCDICEEERVVELSAPEDLVYGGSAKQATVTGSFFHSAPSAITYCCEGGCVNVLNGKTHTATVTIGSYTLTKTFVIQKAPGTASVTIQGWKFGDNPNAPVPSSQTNGANGIIYYYKLKTADDSTYTTTVPTAEGEYILKAVFAAGDNYEEVTVYANFAIGKETPAYTVPTGLTATYGDLLSTVTLPEGWAWKDGGQTVGNAGTNEFVAVFTPEDTENYLTPEVLVQVMVEKAMPSVTIDYTEWIWTNVNNDEINVRVTQVGGGQHTWILKSQNGVSLEISEDGYVSNITKAGGTFVVTYSIAETENYKALSVDFTITLLKAEQDFTVSPSIQSPTIVDEVTLIASGNAGEVTYTTTDQYLTIGGNVLTATRAGNRTVTATAAETDLYEAATQTFSVTFSKAAGNLAPDYELPTGFTICVGRSTDDITLPSDWRFENETIFEQVAPYNVYAIFTPEDLDNYEEYRTYVHITVLDHVGGAAASCTTAEICTECGKVLEAALGHDMSDATCTESAMCQRAGCDYTEGEPLDHDWADADCDTPKTCLVCEETEGEALGHTDVSPKDHVCDNGCGKTDIGTHSDGTDANHLCDYGCGSTADDGCYDTAVDGKCDECGIQIDHECGGGTATCTKPASCSICGNPYGTAQGHDMSEATCTEASKCRRAGCNYTEGNALGHTGGTATCTEEAVCTRCQQAYGGVTGHSDDNFDHICDNACGKTDIGDHIDPDNNHTCNYGCTETIGTCADSDTDHDCDYGCAKFYGEHADANEDHNCDYGCNETIGACVDSDKDHDCDYGGCTKYFGEHSDSEDADHLCNYGCGFIADEGCSDTVEDGICDECGADINHTCVDVDEKDHTCDICSATMGTHEDSATDDDHVCDYGCGDTLEACTGGTATCIAEAVCEICDQPYGSLAAHDYAPATCTAPSTCRNCPETTGTVLDHLDENRDHACDRACGKNDMGDHTDADDDNHLCDYGCGAVADEGCYDTDPVDGKCDECDVTVDHGHTGGTATCTAKAVCDICGQPYGELANHSAETEWQKNETHHWHECTGCDGQELDKAAHNDGNSDGSCDACGYTMTVTPPPHTHAHGSAWVTDEAEHWNECECGDKANKASHADGDNNGKCDACNYTMSTGGEQPGPTPSDPESPANNGEEPIDEEKGCSSTVIGGMAVIMLVCGAAVTLFKKKED